MRVDYGWEIQDQTHSLFGMSRPQIYKLVTRSGVIHRV